MVDVTNHYAVPPPRSYVQADDANEPIGRKDTPGWVPAWSPSKQTLDYCKTIIETVSVLFLGAWIISHLLRRGPLSVMGRIAPGGNSV